MDILPDKDPYHNRGRDQMRKKGGPDFKCLWLVSFMMMMAIYCGHGGIFVGMIWIT
jgi:hypothetical protein